MLAKYVTHIPFGVAFLENFKYKKEPHIGDMEILFSLIIQGITPNAVMNQTNNISCGATHHS